MAHPDPAVCKILSGDWPPVSCRNRIPAAAAISVNNGADATIGRDTGTGDDWLRHPVRAATRVRANTGGKREPIVLGMTIGEVRVAAAHVLPPLLRAAVWRDGGKGPGAR